VFRPKARLRILPGHAYWYPLLILILTIAICLGTQQPGRIRVSIATALSLHSVLLFWNSDGRYALLAWTSTAIAGIAGSYVSWRRSPPTSQAIAAANNRCARPFVEFHNSSRGTLGGVARFGYRA
jgi:hypothetical protein